MTSLSVANFMMFVIILLILWAGENMLNLLENFLLYIAKKRSYYLRFVSADNLLNWSLLHLNLLFMYVLCPLSFHRNPWESDIYFMIYKANDWYVYSFSMKPWWEIIRLSPPISVSKPHLCWYQEMDGICSVQSAASDLAKLTPYRITLSLNLPTTETTN